MSELILHFPCVAQTIAPVSRKTSTEAPAEPHPTTGNPLEGLMLVPENVVVGVPFRSSSETEQRSLGPLFADDVHGIWLYQANSLAVLDAIAERHPHGLFDMIFADPPYFLSNGGITCHAGRMVKVDKGEWDKSRGWAENHNFNTEWLKRCQRVLRPNGTLWVTGTLHVIFSVGFAMQQLGFKILNDIAWEKPNPPPNLSCRYFTHSTETVLWAAKNEHSRHVFNYADMRRENHGKQMKTVWTIQAPTGAEKRCGRHPTQKPLALVERCLRAATAEGALVLDPFLGNGTTAVACRRLNRRCIGFEVEEKYLKQAVLRLEHEAGSLFSARRD